MRRADNDLNNKVTLSTGANEELENQIENQQAQIEKLKEEKQALIRELEQLKEKVNVSLLNLNIYEFVKGKTSVMLPA